VSVAGAFGNILFAFLLATVVWIVGKPSSLQERNAVVGYVVAESPAAAAGLAAGDEVVAVDGRPVATWLELAEKAALAPADAVALRVRTPAGDEREVALALDKLPVGIRVLPGLDGMDLCHVAAVTPGSAAEAAGLAPGDQILRFDGQRLYSRAHMSQLVDASAGRPAEIVYLRNGRERAATVAALHDEKLGRHLIGIQFNTMGDLDYATRAHPTPWAQVKSHAGAIFRFLDALTTPATSGAAADAVGGPILILIMLWLMLRSGAILAVWFTGFINVNLAILNLLPIPVLDGGHVLISLYEWIFRRPPPPRLVNALINVFAVLFLLLFLSLTYRDVARQIVPPLRQWFGR
jgi:regulator of sigma E protease